MPVEIGPPIDGELKEKKNPQITQISQNEKDVNTFYRERYVKPERISATEPDKIHKVIYCVATIP